MYKYFLQDNLNKTFVKKNSRIVNANLVVLFDMEKARKMCDFFSRFIFCTFMKKTHEKKIVNKLQKPHPKKLFAPYLAFLHVGEGVLLFRFIHTLHTHTALVGFFFVLSLLFTCAQLLAVARVVSSHPLLYMNVFCCPQKHNCAIPSLYTIPTHPNSSAHDVSIILYSTLLNILIGYNKTKCEYFHLTR